MCFFFLGGGLKKIVSLSLVLLASLGKAGSENDDLVVNLKAELREAEQDLIATREENKLMEEKLAQSKEEVSISL